MLITRAQSVGIYVNDQQRALEFYRDKLGFEVRQDVPMGADMGDARWIEVAPAGAQTPFILFTPGGLEHRIGGFQNIVFGCDDIKVTHEQLSQQGVEFTQEPSEM